MKRLVFLMLFCVAAVWLAGQNPQWQWAVKAGSDSIDVGRAICRDNAGNTYITGHFTKTASFGSISVSAVGSGSARYSDVFIAKMDNEGNFLWAKRAGGSNEDIGRGISCDTGGNCYVTGWFKGSAVFGDFTITSNGNWDSFVTKIDTNGNFIWAKNAGGINEDYVCGISCDNGGNSYITGFFFGSATFGNTTLTSMGDNPTTVSDIFVAKLNATGEFQWAKRAGGSNYDYSLGICNDSVGNSYITGMCENSANFGSINLIGYGSADTFVAKLDSSGNYLWVQRGEGMNLDWGVSISCTNTGICFVSGSFTGSVVFGSSTLTSVGAWDTFVTKLDTNGTVLWAKSAGGIEDVFSNGITCDNNGNSYITGYFIDSANFGSTLLTAIPHTDGIKRSDIYVSKLDTNGGVVWARSAGGTGWDDGYGIACDNSGNCIIAGMFIGNASFGSSSITSYGNYDIYITRLYDPRYSDEDFNPAVPGISHLYNAYPNPFRQGESAQIKMEIASNEMGTVSVYNVRGQRILTKQLSAGTHIIDVNSQGLASGVYLYQLKTETVESVKKLILVK